MLAVAENDNLFELHDPVPHVFQEREAIAAVRDGDRIGNPALCKRQAVNLAFGDNQAVKSFALRHAEEDRLCVFFTPLLVAFAVESRVAVFDISQNVVLVVKREDQDVRPVPTGGDTVSLYNCPANAAGLKIYNRAFPDGDRALGQLPVHFRAGGVAKIQMVVKIPGQLHEMPGLPTSAAKAFEGPAGEIDGEGVLIPAFPTSAVWAVGEEKLPAFFVDVGVQDAGQVIHVRWFQLVAHHSRILSKIDFSPVGRSGVFAPDARTFSFFSSLYSSIFLLCCPLPAPCLPGCVPFACPFACPLVW